MITLYFLLFLIIFLVCIYDYDIEYFKNDNINIKPYLWIYWEKLIPKIPDYIQMCIDIIHKKGNKNFIVIQLDEKNQGENPYIFNMIACMTVEIYSIAVC